MPHFWGLPMAPTSFRKAHLNILREATVAQAPRAHFDPHRSEGFFFYHEVERVMEALPHQMFGSQAPSCVSSCCRLRWCSFFLAGGRPSDFQDSGGEKRELAMEIELPHPSIHLHTHTVHPAPINAKTPGHDLEPLSVFDGRWVFSKWFNKA